MHSILLHFAKNKILTQVNLFIFTGTTIFAFEFTTGFWLHTLHQFELQSNLLLQH